MMNTLFKQPLQVRWTRMLLAGGCALLAACAPAGSGETQQAATAVQIADASVHSESGLAIVPLTVTSNGATHNFRVELAATPEQQSRGLMFRDALGPGEGMIFPFAVPRFASFWMKNTVIPLDIIFVRTDGSIESIAANTVPYSLDSVQSGEPVAAVLELAGGRAGELGIEPGNVVKWETP